MEFLDFSSHGGSQEAAEEIGSAPAVQHFNPSSSSYGQEQSHAPYLNPNYPAPISCDIKPRLTKEQHDILEAHYQKQNKPNTNTKKGFAESLSVSLDKVNNWFQNRRAKSKQDAKKNAGTVNIFPGHHRTPSDGDISPGFVNSSSNFHVMMQHWTAEREAAHGLGISPVQHTQDQQQMQAYAVQNGGTEPEPLQSYLAPVQYSQNAQDEMNRRTLTQDQFSAMERTGGMVDAYGQFEDLESSFYGDQGVLNTIFPGFNGDLKQEEMFVYPIGAPLSSYDSTVPSNVSDHSLSAFGSSSNIQTMANVSPSSDWTDSRSSSVHDGASSARVPPQHQPPITTAQWQPGQSIPVDPTTQYETFQQVAAQAAQARSSPQLSLPAQSPAWGDDASLRRASTTSLLTQSMSNVGIQTPPLDQGSTFKSSAPPSNIAARRQRAPRPAALGFAALRSQSHNGAVQSACHLPIQHHQFSSSEQPLRRIRSSNYLGGVANGRVMKSQPSSARISPTHYTFADAVNSPHAVRRASHATLAPPTPMSPKESASMEQSGYIQPWQVGPSNTSRQSSFNENDAEHGVNYHHLAFQPPQHRTSPPHTPMSHPHQFVQPRIPGNAIMENTPPQSAPASQTGFPGNVYGVYPSHHMQQHSIPSQPMMHQQTHSAGIPMQHPHPHSQHLMNSVSPEQQFQQSNVVFAQNQSVKIPTTLPPGVPIQFSNGVPITNSEGNIEMVFPAQLHFVHQNQSQGHTPPQNMHTPPQISYPFSNSARASPGTQPTTQLFKPSPDFFVHEWSPPESVKRSATPRKGPIDTVPKNYSFAHTVPEHFEEKKIDEKRARRVDSKDAVPFTSSPASSSGSALTS